MPLDALLLGLWRARWATLAAAVLLAVAGAALIIKLPRRYVAQVVVAPAETTGIATSALLSPTPIVGGGLFDNRPVGNFAVYLDAMRSPEAAAMLARDTPLLAELTAARGVGPLGWLRREFGLRLRADLDDAQGWLERYVSATQGIATVTFTVTVAHRRQDAALDVLRRLHALAEAKVRNDLADLTRRRVAAIEARLATERDTYLRSTLYELLAGQQRAALVVAAEEAVAARLVSAPMVERRPSLPNRSLLLLLLVVLAPLVAVSGTLAIVLLRHAARAPPRHGWPDLDPGRDTGRDVGRNAGRERSAALVAAGSGGAD